MQEYHGRLASGNSFRATPYLVEVSDPNRTVLAVVDVNDITDLRRQGTQVTIQRGKQPPVVLNCASLDDAGRLESIVRPQLRQVAAEKSESRRGLRIAVMVISLMLSFIVLFQSCASLVGDSLEGDEEASGSTSGGFLVALLFIFGGAFALAKPRVSLVVFLVAAAIAIPTGIAGDFSDLIVWGIIAVGLTVMCFFSARRQSPFT